MHEIHLQFLYGTCPGRLILRLLTHPCLSRVCGSLLDTGLSASIVPAFIRKYNIDMSDYEEKDYSSFNDFFTRQVKEGARPICQEDDALISPCDGLLSVWPIKEGLVLPVKQSQYSMGDLLRNKSLADRFQDGLCLVFRLCVNHYHRYCFFDDAIPIASRRIPGRLHTVRPIALRSVPVFAENSREYAVLKTFHFGLAVQMEVGAMLVGKIDNHPFPEKENSMRPPVKRGEEKGKFLYGGSTIIVLLEKDRARLSP
ncbi:MAG: phosphatidylserine decarboxylase, partial [Lachnospiraceae bacterium]|nr:phosphatidylserine decarboxylase [Lachnospiraceae bacterium]